MVRVLADGEQVFRPGIDCTQYYLTLEESDVCLSQEPMAVLSSIPN